MEKIKIIFDGSQTYLGVLATFLVLCIFISKSKEESNFIIYTILKVGEDFVNHLRTLVEGIKTEIRNQSSGGSGITGSLDIRFDQLPDDKKGSVLKNRRDTMMITQRFFHTATKISEEFAPDRHLRDKEELPYIALICLCLIITSLFVDCLGFIPMQMRCLFLNMLLALSLLFIVVIYHKFFYDKYAIVEDVESLESTRKPSVFLILIGFIGMPLFWLFVAPFVCSPAIAITLLITIQVFGGFAVKRKWIQLCHRYNRYNRSMILKHYAIFIIYVLLMCVVINYWEAVLPTIGYNTDHCKYWSDTVILMESQVFCYYFALVFFTFNAVFGPILAGFVYLKRKERNVIRTIRLHQQEIQPLIADLAKEYKRILMRS